MALSAAYTALWSTLWNEMQLEPKSGPDIDEALYLASEKDPKQWALAVEPDGSWAWFIYPEVIIREDLAGWHMHINHSHPNARFFRWNGSTVFEDQILSTFTAKLYYEMAPKEKE